MTNSIKNYVPYLLFKTAYNKLFCVLVHVYIGKHEGKSHKVKMAINSI